MKLVIRKGNVSVRDGTRTWRIWRRDGKNWGITLWPIFTPEGGGASFTFGHCWVLRPGIREYFIYDECWFIFGRRLYSAVKIMTL